MPVFDVTFTSLTAAFTFNGDGKDDFFGYSVSGAGDINGDGFADVIVGAMFDDNNIRFNSGSAQVLSGTDGSVLYTFNGDGSDDRFGESVSSAGDVNGDGFDDVIVGSFRDDNNGRVDSGSARVLSGSDGSVLFTFNGDGARDYFGTSVSGAGDVNGDGFADVIVGASWDDNNGDRSGSARVLSGVDGAVLYSFDGDSAYDSFGGSVSAAGDVNGDGFADVIVGARFDYNSGPDPSGSARVLSGVDGAVLYSFNGDSANDSFGGSVSAAGDVNGDGFDDLVVGAFGDDNNGPTSGSARVLSGADGSVLFNFDGDGADDRFGFSVSGAGDVNGDGFDDLIVGAYKDDNNGLTDSGSARILSGADGTVLFMFDGDGADDRFGISVSGAGDVNGDGFADIIVGASRDDNNGLSNSGSARLFTTIGSGRLNAVRSATEGGAAVVIDSDVAVADAAFDALNGGNGDYHGAAFTVARQGGADVDDTFSFGAMANVTVSGGNFQVFGVTIATFIASAGMLSVAFTNANGTAPSKALVNEILQAAQISTVEQAPGAGIIKKLVFEWSFSDGVDTLIDTFFLAETGIDSDDIIIGTSGVNIIDSGIGSDIVSGRTGADILSGNIGNDTLNGQGGSDTLNGDAGDDILVGGVGNDTLNGGDDSDRLYGQGGVDLLFGDGGNDDLHGQAGADRLDGGAGDDRLFVDSADSLIQGGSGFDTVYALAGQALNFNVATANVEWVYGHSGADILNAATAITRVVLHGRGNDDQLTTGSGDDTQIGGAGNDTMNGGGGLDRLYGQIGMDTINGEAGNDQLFGQQDNDILNAGAGRDFLFGGAGDDTLTGGGLDAERDLFVFQTGAGIDIITDYEDGVDRIQFRAIAATTQFSDLAIANDGGGNAVVTYSEGTVTLNGIDQSLLDASDFLF